MIIGKSKLIKKLEEVEPYCNVNNSTLEKELNKLIPTAPIKAEIVFYKGFLIQEFGCPTCGSHVGDEMLVFNYCPKCGQRIKQEGI